MDIRKVAEVLERKGKAACGAPGLDCVLVDNDQVTFTTDCPEWRGSDIREVLEFLLGRFDIDTTTITLHRHPGDKHDVDISFHAPKGTIPDVVTTICEEFYDDADWEVR